MSLQHKLGRGAEAWDERVPLGPSGWGLGAGAPTCFKRREMCVPSCLSDPTPELVWVRLGRGDPPLSRECRNPLPWSQASW